jgi:hypothetical protein
MTMLPFLVPDNTILIWRPEDVPEEIRLTIENYLTPDTVWVAFVPGALDTGYISFLQSTSFSEDGGPEKVGTAFGSIYLGRKAL